MASVLSKKQKKKQKNTTLSHLKTLGHDLLSSRAHINNLPTLLSFVSSASPPQYVLESLLSLQAFFTPVLPDLPSASTKPSAAPLTDSQDDPEFIYRTWLRAKFDEFVKSLIDISVSPQSDETLKEVVLDTLMEFVKLGSGGGFNSAIHHKLIYGIVHSTTPDTFVVDLLVSKYFKYIDVRYFTYISVEKISRTLEEKDVSDGNNRSPSGESTENFIHKIHYILSRVPPLEGTVDKTDYDMWSGSGESENSSGKQKGEDKKTKSEQHTSKTLTAANGTKRMKLKFTKAWISFLRLPLPLDVYKEVLVNLHQAVIPYLSNPVMLCDFLTRSYDIGGVISVMALSSLYVLMTQHGLEYPNFFEKLYALLVPSIFMAKHRSKFLQLLDSCLKSPLLPAYLAAAFAKKLSRLSISVPPSGALVIVALIHNLLRRHPSINCLVHREDEETAKGDPEADKRVSNNSADPRTDADVSVKKLGVDHFNNEENDPKKSKAMRSSLWEIDTLRHHYCPPVSRFVLSLENDLTIRRRVKQVPLAFYKATPTSLFSESDFAGWTFKLEELGEDDHTVAKRPRI
ncbi:Nucleolar complex protein [Trema orientale]|uniref:Nucleolar complex protein n=1 Tax=Trema orientale TaxID=63057 RepID=A0A2P5EWJ1_TREOI|nr:Nucleolar complex protein [Trema orientale]